VVPPGCRGTKLDTSMLHIAIILGWLIAFCLILYLATQAIKDRLLERRQRKRALRKIRKFRRHHHFDEKRQRWVRNVDGVVVHPDEF
jgi:predicted membrane protein